MSNHISENVQNFEDTNYDSRKTYVENVKAEMLFFNFGLPSNPNYINLEWDDVIPKIRALYELWVRLNVYLANGQQQSGTINFPEASRIIDFRFDSQSVDNCYVRFYSTRNTRSQ